MSTLTMKDGTQIYYKDWGTGHPAVFSHGWPLSSDSWETQMVFLASNGYGCICHDRYVLVTGYAGPGHKNAFDCIKAFSETDFTEDLKKFDIPTLIIHGDDDQIVPIGASALRSAKLVRNSTLKIYAGAPHTALHTRTKTSSTPTCWCF